MSSSVESAEWVLFMSTFDSLGLPVAQTTAFRTLWGALKLQAGRTLRLPTVEPTEEFKLAVRWSLSSFYAEIEISKDGQFEWFFRDRIRNSHKGSSDPERAVPVAFLNVLSTALNTSPNLVI